MLLKFCKVEELQESGRRKKAKQLLNGMSGVGRRRFVGHIVCPPPIVKHEIGDLGGHFGQDFASKRETRLLFVVREEEAVRYELDNVVRRHGSLRNSLVPIQSRFSTNFTTDFSPDLVPILVPI